MSEHISQLEWVQCFGEEKTQDNLALRNRILTHVMTCQECRAFFDAATELDKALEAYAAALDQVRPSVSDWGYQAVASLSSSEKNEEESIFSVMIDMEDNTAVFLTDTIRCSGGAKQYAVNPQNGNRCLQEDLNAFRMEVQGGELRIRVEDDLVGRVCVILTSVTQDVQLRMEHNDACFPLEDNDIYALKLIFE